MRASASEGDRQNRFLRSVFATESWTSDTQTPPRGRTEVITPSCSPRTWSVTPPRCAAEMPRPNVDYGAHRDVSPLGSQITPRVHQHQGYDVGKRQTLFPDSVTDEPARIFSAPTPPRGTYTRPDELHLPAPRASEVHRAEPLPSSHSSHIMNLLGRGASVVRAAVAFERPMLRRHNAVRKRSGSTSQKILQHHQETTSIEVRLGLVKPGQQ